MRAPMREDLVLTGHEYRGRFLAEQKVASVGVGRGYSESEEDRYYWSGQGVVEYKYSTDKQRFTFSTFGGGGSGSGWSGRREREIGFVQQLFRFAQFTCGNGYRTNVDLGSVRNLTPIVDRVLQGFYEDARNECDSGVIIPNLHPRLLDINNLEELGFVANNIFRAA